MEERCARDLLGDSPSLPGDPDRPWSLLLPDAASSLAFLDYLLDKTGDWGSI